MNKKEIYNIVIDFPSDLWLIDKQLPYKYNPTLDNLKAICEFVHKQAVFEMYRRNGYEHQIPIQKIIKKKTYEYTCFQHGDIDDPIFDPDEHYIDVIFSLNLN